MMMQSVCVCAVIACYESSKRIGMSELAAVENVHGLFVVVVCWFSLFV